MMQVVSPLMPFPNICWWLLAAEAGSVLFDEAEHFAKMSYRNRYYITGANGLIQLSVPLAQGRNQRTTMQDVRIDNKERWQVQQWRTIFSVYGRAPYFEYYAPSLEDLFHREFDKLVAFNRATIGWAKEHTGIRFNEETTGVFVADYGAGKKDLRATLRPGVEKTPHTDEMYYQLFAERNGFYPNLSILDLLFSEGPAAKTLINEQQQLIREWMK